MLTGLASAWASAFAMEPPVSWWRMGLDTVEILMEIEDEFGISVPDDVASRMVAVGDTYRDIIDRLVAKGAERSAEMDADVWQRLVLIVTKQLGIKPECVRPESRWIPDITPYG